jgi:hypothetical protein
MTASKHEQHVPHDSEKPLPTDRSRVPRESGSKQPGIADADKRVRSGTADEAVRSTPPAGKWNDVSPNE